MAKKAGELTTAVAYFRTSSAANVGADKDSEKRQRQAVDAFARQAGFAIVDAFYDAAVSGADPIDTRPGFAAMLKRIETNGVRTILVESANRFARDLMVQEVGHARLRERGIDLIAADNPSSFLDDTPTARLVRQVLGAIAEFDKTMTVAELRGARERKRAAVGKCEGPNQNAAGTKAGGRWRPARITARLWSPRDGRDLAPLRRLTQLARALRIASADPRRRRLVCPGISRAATSRRAPAISCARATCRSTMVRRTTTAEPLSSSTFAKVRSRAQTSEDAKSR
jgi:DNA invertase Pin-like site-specific DNA recombinase